MKITKVITSYEVEADGRVLRVSSFPNSTDVYELKPYQKPSGENCVESVRILILDRHTPESDIERVLAEALA